MSTTNTYDKEDPMNRTKRLLDLAEALGFTIESTRAGHWEVFHANQPDQKLKINTAMAENTARVVEQKMKQIAGLASTSTEKVDPRERRKAQAERRRQERLEREQRKREGVAQAGRRRTAEEQVRSRQNLEALMREPAVGARSSGTDTDFARAVVAYQRGHQWMDAARRYQVSPEKLRNHLQAAGLWREKKRREVTA